MALRDVGEHAFRPLDGVGVGRQEAAVADDLACLGGGQEVEEQTCRLGVSGPGRDGVGDAEARGDRGGGGLFARHREEADVVAHDGRQLPRRPVAVDQEDTVALGELGGGVDLCGAVGGRVVVPLAAPVDDEFAGGDGGRGLDGGALLPLTQSQ